jgi:ribosome maturation factor RimP
LEQAEAFPQGTKGLGTRGFFLAAFSPSVWVTNPADMAAQHLGVDRRARYGCFQVVIEPVGLVPIFLFLRKRIVMPGLPSPCFQRAVFGERDVRQAPENIQTIVRPVVEALGYEVVGVEFLIQGKHGLLRVYIDSEDGITVDDCQRVSHQLSGVLDVEDVIQGQYQLEISSPGLDRPLFTKEHFERFAGHMAKLRLAVPVEGQRKFKGRLLGVTDDNLRLEVEGEELSFPLNAIDKANLIPEI